jgi:hypothetical protein
MRWIMVVALAACGDPAATVVPDAAPPGTIGPQGGTLEFGEATLVVPPGALDHDVVITAGALLDFYEPTAVTGAFVFGPEALVFAVPATVTFTLQKPPFDLTIKWLDGMAYKPLPSTTTTTTLSAQITHLGSGFAARANPGFVAPTTAIVANGGTLDLSCLGVARNDAPSTGQVVTAHVTDFQSGNLDSNALITVFPTLDVTGLSFSTATTDSSGNALVSVPSGSKRVAFQLLPDSMISSGQTWMFDQLASATTLANQTISNSTKAVLPALIGVTPATGASLLVDRVTDCQGHPLQNLIGTVSSTPGTATSLPGADTYYFNGSVGLPTKHASQMATDSDGQLMVIDLPAATSAYLQAWGYRDANELAAEQLTLIAELKIAVPQDSSIIQDQTPAATTP